MRFIIEPYIGAGEIKFFMNRDQTHGILACKSSYEEFYRTPQSKNISEHYIDLCLIINYDENDLCDTFEFLSPAALIFQEITPLGMTYEKIFEYFKQKDYEIEEDNSGFISYKYGIGVYAPFKMDNPLEKIESIIVFKKGYYS